MVPTYRYFPGLPIPRWNCFLADDGFGNLLKVDLQAHDEVSHFLHQPADALTYSDIIEAANQLTRK